VLLYLTQWGETALYKAASEGHTVLVTYFLDLGANIEVTGSVRASLEYQRLLHRFLKCCVVMCLCINVGTTDGADGSSQVGAPRDSEGAPDPRRQPSCHRRGIFCSLLFCSATNGANFSLLPFLPPIYSADALR
jgi:hypothetical protein